MVVWRKFSTHLARVNCFASVAKTFTSKKHTVGKNWVFPYIRGRGKLRAFLCGEKVVI